MNLVAETLEDRVVSKNGSDELLLGRCELGRVLGNEKRRKLGHCVFEFFEALLLVDCRF